MTQGQFFEVIKTTCSHRMSQSADIQINLKSHLAPVKAEIIVEKPVTALLNLKTFYFYF